MRKDQFITCDSGKWWCWAQRIWQDIKKPAMGAEIEIQMARRSEPSARIIE